MKTVDIISKVVGRDSSGKPVGGGVSITMGNCALKSDFESLKSMFNDFLEGDDTDSVINRWKDLEAFLNGISEEDPLTSILGNYIPISGTTEITGEKNFVGGLKVNGSPIYYDPDKKYWKLEGDLLITGGVTMYGTDSNFVPSTIMDAILYDSNTLGINSSGQLYVKGSVGGATTMGSLSNVGSWADSVASQDRIMYQAANSSQWVAKNLSDLAVGGVTGDYLPLSGGTLTGTINTQFIRPSVNAAYQCGTSSLRWDNVYSVYGNFSDSVTINGNTAWHAGNDGSDSGLDADLLDGKHYSDIINGNVASATKLQTARTIWGQSFNGTGNVDGTFTVTSNENLPIRIHSYYSSSWVSAILATNTSLVAGQHFNINVGYGDSAYNNAWFGYYHAGVGSTSNRLSMGLHSVDDVINILGTGNVGIGTTNPTEKLQVAGNIWSDGDISCKKRVSAYQNVATQLGTTTYNIKNALYNGGQFNSVANNDSVPMLNWGAKSTNGQSTYFSIHSFHPTDGAGILIFGVANESYGRTAFIEVQGSGLIQAGGNFLATGGITMYSDIRKKTKLKYVVLSLQQVANAPLIEHYYNSDQNKTTHVGSIAQYWAEMNDWFCKKDSEGYYTMEIQNAALASAISVARELVKFETETDRRIRLLEEENKRLKEEVEQLKWNIA